MTQTFFSDIGDLILAEEHLNKLSALIQDARDRLPSIADPARRDAIVSHIEKKLFSAQKSAWAGYQKLLEAK
jgi:hypothetical protein